MEDSQLSATEQLWRFGVVSARTAANESTNLLAYETERRSAPGTIILVNIRVIGAVRYALTCENSGKKISSV
ncbi:hypothetical protein KIN20_024928 [Parelaphostrongylus tenuis]|uniref:Uncharacterized protein n=1 Tax=Parelaphostrongylus tenuis TaxID=148309 RepID=A0AAD5NAD3_PARTN|nr:hypothetical protein KIN20_024928 [Parelaphostrongylus tenuis]